MFKADVIEPTCISSTEKVEAGTLEVQVAQYSLLTSLPTTGSDLSKMEMDCIGEPQ